MFFIDYSDTRKRELATRMKNLPLPDTDTSIHSIRDHFFRVNAQRIQLTQESLTVGQNDFLMLLPLLFHINHPQFPGYISKNTPSGISHYYPYQSTLRAAKKHFKSFQHNRRARFKMDIYGIYFMGSSGSIAYSNKSDFDVWLIHSDDLSETGIEELNEKALAIEKWATELKLEVHFFIFSSQSFRSGEHQSLSSESSGSSQHYLLLDEFYRSSLLIAGRYPAWWLVPPEQENNYEQYTDMLFNKRFVDKADVIDFGSPVPVPADEFFGAAVWQLYKGINSPYKSVLKLLLMEVYASEHPHIELLSTRFKQLIYTGEKEIACLDPYIILYKRIEEYLMSGQDRDRLNTFRECFYFKINEKLSRKIRVKNCSWRRNIFQNMVLDWGWDNEHFMLLDINNLWKIDDVARQKTKLIKTLTESYRVLSNFARRHSDVYRISETELNVLGRKLYAAFERKPGKIEIVNRGIAPDTVEPELSFIQTMHHQTKTFWTLYRGRVSPSSTNDIAPLKRAQSFMELITWCHLNQVMEYHTALLLHSLNDNITVRQIRDILEALQQLFPGGHAYEPDFHDLSNTSTIKHAAMFVNVEANPVTRLSGGERLLTSDRNDALSYGGLHKNLAQKFDLIITTSWDEVLIYHYDGMDGLMQCICDFLSWSPDTRSIPDASLSVFSFSANYGNTISKRIKTLIKDITHSIYGKNGHDQCRYILEAEDVHYVLEFKDGKFQHRDSLSNENLYRFLGQPVVEFIPVIFDRHNHWKSCLPYIYQLNQKSVIQIFYFTNTDEVNIYILDEQGTLFRQTTPFFNDSALIDHYNQFFNSILNRKRFITGDMLNIDNIETEYYEIRPSKSGKFNITRVDTRAIGQNHAYTEIKVIGSLDKNENTTLSIYCDDMEFSSLDQEPDVFRTVARHIIAKRQDGKPYPIYITDIDFSRGILNVIAPENLQTIHFLNYKKRIEEKLNLALKSITA